ncbi:MAG: hypothetical protein QXS19_06505 [Candidatus Methanomethylicia archaeon]
MIKDKVNTKLIFITIMLLHIPVILPITKFYNQLKSNFDWYYLIGFIVYCLMFGLIIPINIHKAMKENIEEKIKDLITKHGRSFKISKFYLYFHSYVILITSLILVLEVALFYLISKDFLHQFKFYGALVLITLPIVFYYELKEFTN